MIERLLLLMNKNGVNALTLTTELGLSNSAVTDWKKGKAKPSADAIIKLADYFGVTTDYLLKGEKPHLRLEKEYIIMDKDNKNKGDKKYMSGSVSIGFGVSVSEMIIIKKAMRDFVSKHIQDEELRESLAVTLAKYDIPIENDMDDAVLHDFIKKLLNIEHDDRVTANKTISYSELPKNQEIKEISQVALELGIRWDKLNIDSQVVVRNTLVQEERFNKEISTKQA